jgi:hypothetical protein
MNDVSLREYLEMRLDGVEKAIKKSEESMLTRMAGMNEFREQINKERGDYVTKELFAVRNEAVDKRMGKLEQASSFSAGKMWMVMAFFALVPTIIGVIALVN